MTNEDRDAGLVQVTAGKVTLEGNLLLPENARGMVVFAHGSGSSRFSSRNRAVARALREGGLGTLLLDLLTPGEEEADLDTGRFRFDIELLAERVTDAVHWAASRPRRPSRSAFSGPARGAGPPSWPRRGCRPG